MPALPLVTGAGSGGPFGRHHSPVSRESEVGLPTIRVSLPPKKWAQTQGSAKIVRTAGEWPRETLSFSCAVPAFPGLIPCDGPASWGAWQRRKGKNVKLIVAAIKPFKLEEVREALTAIGVRGMMVTEIKGFGNQSGHTEIYRGAEYAVNFVPKVRLEIVVSDALADQVVATIQKTARTDKIGDGKIFVLDVEHAVRVRTGETDDDAL
jgi:nitrogen regulatory protein P-II 1